MPSSAGVVPVVAARPAKTDAVAATPAAVTAPLESPLIAVRDARIKPLEEATTATLEGGCIVLSLANPKDD